MDTSLRRVIWYIATYIIVVATEHILNLSLSVSQWSYGVTMWEIGGKAPYPGTDPLTLT